MFRLFTINTSIYNFDFNISIYYLFSVCFLCFFLILYFHPICFHIGFCSPTEAMFSWHYWGFQENSSNVLLGPVVSHFPIIMLLLSSMYYLTYNNFHRPYAVFTLYFLPTQIIMDFLELPFINFPVERSWYDIGCKLFPESMRPSYTQMHKSILFRRWVLYQLRGEGYTS